MKKSLLANQNHLYDLARRSGLRLPAGLSESAVKLIDRLYPILAIVFSLITPFFAGLFALVPMLVMLVIENSRLSYLISPNLQLLVVLVSSFLPIYFIVWLWIFLLEKRQLWTIGLEKQGAVKKFAKGGLLGLILFSAVVGLLAVFNYIRIENPQDSTYTWDIIWVVMLLAGWIIQGGAEEILARGYLLPVVGSRYGTVVGIIVSSLVFSTWHLLNPNLSMLAVVNLALYGVFAAFYALREGGLWGVCAFHAVWNWVQGNFFGFEVSGGILGGASLLKLQETGPDWITGGKFGPEGGLAVTIVLIAACVWLLLLSARKESIDL